MSDRERRVFELTATVNFPTVPADELDSFVPKLAEAVRSVIGEFPTAVAFFVAPDGTGDVAYGVRFDGADPRYMESMADEIMEKAVQLMGEDEGRAPIQAEREESVLVLA